MGNTGEGQKASMSSIIMGQKKLVAKKGYKQGSGNPEDIVTAPDEVIEAFKEDQEHFEKLKAFYDFLKTQHSDEAPNFLALTGLDEEHLQSKENLASAIGGCDNSEFPAILANLIARYPNVMD